MKKHLLSNYNVKKDSFASIFEVEKHNMLVKRGERRFSHKALLGKSITGQVGFIFKICLKSPCTSISASSVLLAVHGLLRQILV